jgi:hypothetical protein
MSYIDDDSRGSAESKDAEANPSPYADAEHDLTFEVFGDLDLPQAWTARRSNRRQKRGASSSVASRWPHERAKARRSQEHNRSASAAGGDLADVANVVSGPRQAGSENKAVECPVAGNCEAIQLGLRRSPWHGGYLRGCPERR